MTTATDDSARDSSSLGNRRKASDEHSYADNAFLEKNGAAVEFVEIPGIGHDFAAELMPPIGEWLAAALEGKKQAPR